MLFCVIFASPAQAGSDRRVKILLFMQDICPSCENLRKIESEINGIAREQGFYGNFRIDRYNTLLASHRKYFDEVLEAVAPDAKNVSLPCVVAGNQVIPQKEWAERLAGAVVSEIASPGSYPEFVFNAEASEGADSDTGQAGDDTEISDGLDSEANQAGDDTEASGGLDSDAGQTGDDTEVNDGSDSDAGQKGDGFSAGSGGLPVRLPGNILQVFWYGLPGGFNPCSVSILLLLIISVIAASFDAGMAP